MKKHLTILTALSAALLLPTAALAQDAVNTESNDGASSAVAPETAPAEAAASESASTEAPVETNAPAQAFTATTALQVILCLKRLFSPAELPGILISVLLLLQRILYSTILLCLKTPSTFRPGCALRSGISCNRHILCFRI